MNTEERGGTRGSDFWKREADADRVPICDLPVELNELSSRVIGCAMEVHSTLGSGLAERHYEEAMAYELAGSVCLSTSTFRG